MKRFELSVLNFSPFGVSQILQLSAAYSTVLGNDALKSGEFENISIIFPILALFFYIFVAFVKKPKKYESDKMHRFAVMIAARNEAGVVGNLIDSIKAQNYPSDLVDVYVVADNCTDNTVEVVKNAGAIVYERNNQKVR